MHIFSIETFCAKLIIDKNFTFIIGIKNNKGIIT